MPFTLTGDSTELTLEGLNNKVTTTANGIKVDGSAVTQPVSIAGTVQTTSGVSSAATTSNVAASITNVQLLAPNASRKGAFFYYEGTNNLFLKLGTTATATSYTIRMPGTGFYELPSNPIYTGEIDGIWDVAGGTVRITELT